MKERTYYYKFNYDTVKSCTWTGRVELDQTTIPTEPEIINKINQKYQMDVIFNLRNIRRK